MQKQWLFQFLVSAYALTVLPYIEIQAITCTIYNLYLELNCDIKKKGRHKKGRYICTIILRK